jgi:hypothetical protein
VPLLLLFSSPGNLTTLSLSPADSARIAVGQQFGGVRLWDGEAFADAPVHEFWEGSLGIMHVHAYRNSEGQPRVVSSGGIDFRCGKDHCDQML